MTVCLNDHLPAGEGTWSGFGPTFVAAIGSWRSGAKEADSGMGADIEVFPREPDPGFERRRSG